MAEANDASEAVSLAQGFALSIYGVWTSFRTRSVQKRGEMWTVRLRAVGLFAEENCTIKVTQSGSVVGFERK